VTGELARAAQLISRTSRLAVLTGAGISKESGIPTFREAQDGLWAKYDPMDMASEEGFRRDPTLVWEWYEYRFGMVKTARPNAGHLAIAQMEHLLPTVTVITQNIDGLHVTAGSSHVLEIHGSIQRYKCLSGRHTGFSLEDVIGQSERPPRCPKCGDLLRPDVVWFGEYLPEEVMRAAYDATLHCDAMLVVGTSGVVQPAASLPYLAARTGGLVIDVNPERDEISDLAEVFLQGKGGEVLPELLQAIKTLLHARDE
jgi:NAD-dependent deacetylase